MKKVLKTQSKPELIQSNSLKFITLFVSIILQKLEQQLPKIRTSLYIPQNRIFLQIRFSIIMIFSAQNLFLVHGRSSLMELVFKQVCSLWNHSVNSIITTHPEEQIMLRIEWYNRRNHIKRHPTHETRATSFICPQTWYTAESTAIKVVEILDVFWPVSADYQNKYDAQLAKYNAIIPASETPKFLAEGFKFTEGPTWLNGTLYFSSMFFDIPAGTWKSDPQKSDLIAMKADGTYKVLWQGKTQTNGLIANTKTNTIIACDMSGHRIIEIDESGNILKVVASQLADGTRLDGPNDLVLDAKGGIYFTDPQFIFDTPARPGKTVNYMKPNGEVIEIIPPGEFGMENGVELSPDGKTLYVNNTYHDANRPSEMENYFAAYDVNEDGTVSNKRKFGKAFLPESEYFVAGTRSSTMDGSCVDQAGNIYQATNIGLQIFDNTGKYIGTVFTPTFPVSVAFGGDNLDTLYMTCWDKIYSIKTNMKGLVYPLKSDSGTSVESENPLGFALLNNYPNPFNPTTTIEYNITKSGLTNLSIYNISGQKVCDLFSGYSTPGKHSVVWNGRDSKGTPVSSGTFITRLKTSDSVISNRMMLVK